MVRLIASRNVLLASQANPKALKWDGCQNFTPRSPQHGSPIRPFNLDKHPDWIATDQEPQPSNAIPKSLEFRIRTYPYAVNAETHAHFLLNWYDKIIAGSPKDLHVNPPVPTGLSYTGTIYWNPGWDPTVDEDYVFPANGNVLYWNGTDWIDTLLPG